MYETASPPNPTDNPRPFSNEVIIIIACCSCALFLVLVVSLLLLLFRRDRHCCRSLLSSCTRINSSPEERSGHHQSSLHLVDAPQSGQNRNGEMGYVNPASESTEPYIIAPPECYQLSEWMHGLPRLPSYESVRKKDRQQEIHQLIAERFGLNGPSCDDEQNPPSYEESLRSAGEQLNESIDPHISVTVFPSRCLELSNESSILEVENVSEESCMMSAESNTLEQASVQAETCDSEVPVPCTDSNMSVSPNCTETVPP